MNTFVCNRCQEKFKNNPWIIHTHKGSIKCCLQCYVKYIHAQISKN